jgi:hypothetical protein
VQALNWKVSVKSKHREDKFIKGESDMNRGSEIGGE